MFKLQSYHDRDEITLNLTLQRNKNTERKVQGNLFTLKHTNGSNLDQIISRF